MRSHIDNTGRLHRTALLICDELGYQSFGRAGAELSSQVSADRHERKSLLLLPPAFGSSAGADYRDPHTPGELASAV